MTEAEMKELAKWADERVRQEKKREKLIELIQAAVDGCATYRAGLIADHLIANGVTIQEWISVTERLPQHFGTFLVAIDEVHGENRISVDSADYDPYAKKWSTFNYFCAGYKVTHWMPLPTPPKGE